MSIINGRTFILVRNHKPLLALFGPTKPTLALTANRLARWTLKLSQYDYTIEYRKTSEHGNADVLSTDFPSDRKPLQLNQKSQRRKQQKTQFFKN